MKLIQGDCLEVMMTLPAQSVDAIITDLPYGTTNCKWDSVIPFAPMWEAVKHVLKPKGAFVTTASQPFTSALVMSNPKWFRYEWIWHKNTPSGFAYSKFQPLRYHENILVFSNEKSLYNAQPTERKSEGSKARLKYKLKSMSSMSNHTPMKDITRKHNPEIKTPETVLVINTEPNSLGKLHPTQKPVALYEYLIRTYTNEGDTVLDMTMGSGTTGLACQNTGREFIGIERDPDYFLIAKQRLGA